MIGSEPPQELVVQLVSKWRVLGHRAWLAFRGRTNEKGAGGGAACNDASEKRGGAAALAAWVSRAP